VLRALTPTRLAYFGKRRRVPRTVIVGFPNPSVALLDLTGQAGSKGLKGPRAKMYRPAAADKPRSSAKTPPKSELP